MHTAEPLPLDADETAYWCLGLPLVGTRRLGEAERPAVRARIERARRRCVVTAAAWGALLSGAVALAVGAGPPPGAAVAAWTILGLVGGLGLFRTARAVSLRRGPAHAVLAVILLILPGLVWLAAYTGGTKLPPEFPAKTASLYLGLLLLGATERMGRLPAFVRRCRALLVARRELEAEGRVQVFEAAAGVAAAGLPEHRRLEVLPRSHILLRDHRGLLRSPKVAPVVRLAPPRLFALRVSVPDARTTDPNLRIHRRSLSPDERAELRAQASRLRRHVAPVAAAAVGLALEPVLEWALLGSTGPGRWYTPGMLLWYAVFTGSLLTYLVRLRAAARLDRDAGLHFLVTVDPADRSPAAAVPNMEVLPISRLLWTEAGRPAVWRLQP